MMKPSIFVVLVGVGGVLGVLVSYKITRGIKLVEGGSMIRFSDFLVVFRGFGGGFKGSKVIKSEQCSWLGEDWWGEGGGRVQRRKGRGGRGGW